MQTKKSEGRKASDRDKTLELRKRVGNLVAALRRPKGMTQHDLAEAAGISPDMVARIETGATGVRFLTLVNLAEALHVDVAELFTPDLPKGALRRAKLTEVTGRLAKLSDPELEWADGVLTAALKPRP